jgi:predicted protein tyrosine phosphatase
MFICAHGQNRSPTAANMAKLMADRVDMPIYSAHLSCGIRDDNLDDLGVPYMTAKFNSYDKLFVMEDYMVDKLTMKYKINPKKIVCLDIPDIYHRGDSKLVGILEEKLDEWIK